MNIDRLLDYAADLPLPISKQIKARDKREPDRLLKLKLERRIRAAILRHWRREIEAIKPVIERELSMKVSRDILTAFDDFEDEDFFSDIFRALLDAAKRGIDIFRGRVNIGFDDTLINANAARWARDYAFELIKDITKTTRDILAGVISKFIETPGMTIGDIVRQLPYNESRSLTIAVTETTRAYAEGEIEAGRGLQEQFPGVEVIKEWFTNNDDRVCEICGPLHGQIVEIDEPFEGGDGEDYMAPPAHPNCRCWVSSTTRIE